MPKKPQGAVAAYPWPLKLDQVDVQRYLAARRKIRASLRSRATLTAHPDNVPMKDLIEALTIFAKYTDAVHPTQCEHDALYVLVDPADVTAEDRARLEVLGFTVRERDGCFCSFRFGGS